MAQAHALRVCTWVLDWLELSCGSEGRKTSVARSGSESGGEGCAFLSDRGVWVRECDFNSITFLPVLWWCGGISRTPILNVASPFDMSWVHHQHSCLLWKFRHCNLFIDFCFIVRRTWDSISFSFFNANLLVTEWIDLVRKSLDKWRNSAVRTNQDEHGDIYIYLTYSHQQRLKHLWCKNHGVSFDKLFPVLFLAGRGDMGGSDSLLYDRKLSKCFGNVGWWGRERGGVS